MAIWQTLRHLAPGLTLIAAASALLLVSDRERVFTLVADPFSAGVGLDRSRPLLHSQAFRRQAREACATMGLRQIAANVDSLLTRFESVRRAELLDESAAEVLRAAYV